MKKSIRVVAIVLLVLLIDQSFKIWVKTHMSYGDEIKILGLDWALIHFVENNGMAFGITLGGEYGKLALSIFRVVAVGFLIYYIRLLLDTKASFGLLASFGLILAGALGNILDSAFYGLIFSESPYHGGVAEVFPPGGGYASFLHGKVVDMLYFPMFQGTFPEWFPIWGAEPFLFFKPVFNIADMSITIGVLSILFFHRSFFNNQNPEEILSEDGEEKDTKSSISESTEQESLSENDQETTIVAKDPAEEEKLTRPGGDPAES